MDLLSKVMSNFKKIEELSKMTMEISDSFYYYLNSLIHFLSKKIRSRCIQKLNSSWILAKVLPKIDIIDQCYEYFLIFEDHVANERRDIMLEYDYEELVVENCDPDTKGLIIALSNSVKNLYREGDPAVNKRIDEYVKKMTSASSSYSIAKAAQKKLSQG